MKGFEGLRNPGECTPITLDIELRVYISREGSEPRQKINTVKQNLFQVRKTLVTASHPGHSSHR